jgi:hypothetical protein
VVSFSKFPLPHSFNGIPSAWDALKNLKPGTVGPKGTPPGTVPIGDSGFYVTPNTPADPRDCARYPSSPWCGGIPFGLKLFSPGLSLSISNCGFDVKAEPTVFYVKFPIQQLSYRFPGDCRKDPPKDLPPEDPPLGTTTVSGTWQIPQDSRIVYCFGSISSLWNYPAAYTYKCVDISCPGVSGSEVSCNLYAQIPETNASTDGPYKFGSTQNWFYTEVFFNDDGKINYTYYYNDAQHPVVVTDASVTITQSVYVNYTTHTFGGGIFIIKGTGKACYIYVSKTLGSTTLAIEEASQTINVDACLDTKCRTPNPYDNNPPPDPPDKGCKCMACCNDPNNNSDSLLKQILALLQKLNGVVGVTEWPASVPANILVRQGLSNGNIQLNTITDFMEWWVKQFDAVIGRFGIDIQVDDIDPTKPGNQTLKMNLPNLSESVAEMVGLLLHISMTVDSLQNINIRNLAESGSTKQQAFVNYIYLKAMSDYMGFPRNDKSFPLSLSFKPNETHLDQLLQDTQIKVKGIEYNTSKPRLKDNLQDLLHAAAIIKALHWRKLDTGGSIKQQLFDMIKGQAANAMGIGGNQPDPKTGKTDFDQFIEDFESGFQNYGGVDSDLSKTPYGRPFNERPQVNKLTNPPNEQNKPGTNL